MDNEKKYHYIVYGVGIILVLLIGWFMWFYEPDTGDNHDVEGGLQRIERGIDDVKGHIDESKGTTENIERTVDDSEKSVESIERTNNAAEESVGNAERANSDVENSIDRSINWIERCQGILGKYEK